MTKQLEFSCDKAKILKDILRFSKSANLQSGQLWLTDEEAEILNNLLFESSKEFAWKFEMCPQKTLQNNIKVSYDKQKQSRAKQPSLNIDTIAPVQKKRHTKQRSNVAANPCNISQLSQSQIRRLPEWAQNFHSILMMLSQTELIKNFLGEIPATDANIAEVCEKIKPGLSPIGISTIISKLEQNGYQNALDAFNDVYSVWLIAYRIYTPGSPMWMQTHQASRAFMQQIANYPLKDNFNTRNSKLKEVSDNESTDSKSVHNEENEKGAAVSVEQIFQEFFTPKESASTPFENNCSSLTDISATRSKTKYRAPVPPITDNERKMFKYYLSQLETKHHLRLFEAFQKAAIWKVIEGGEVELDDAKTNSLVFRKMIAWCRSQMTVENRKGLGKSVPGVPSTENLKQSVEESKASSSEASSGNSSDSSRSSQSNLSDSTLSDDIEKDAFFVGKMTNKSLI